MTKVKKLARSHGTALTRYNALRHGLLSQHTVLPWEDAAEYDALLASLVAEHEPRGPTEEHLVEEIAGILWRKRRLRLAEAASYRRGLKMACASPSDIASAAMMHAHGTTRAVDVGEAVRATPEATARDIDDIAEDETMTRRALALLASGRDDAYETGLAELRVDTRQWWAEELEHDDLRGQPADAEALRHFLETRVMPWFDDAKKELHHRDDIRAQAFGDAVRPDQLDRLARYEVHFDRKLERMLTMLIRLQELRDAKGSEE